MDRIEQIIIWEYLVWCEVWKGEIYKIRRWDREEKIKFFLKFIRQLNQELQKAKRERSKKVIKDNIKKELARLKITRFFEKPRLSKNNRGKLNVV